MNVRIVLIPQATVRVEPVINEAILTVQDKATFIWYLLTHMWNDVIYVKIWNYDNDKVLTLQGEI